MQSKNRQFKLASRPNGLPNDMNWSFSEEPIPSLIDGEFLVKVKYISLDPAMRGWIREGKSYTPPVKIGEIMRALGVGEVIESKHSGFAVGDFVSGIFGVQAYAKSKGDMVNKVYPTIAPLPVFLSALGMTGLTAYFGLLDVGELKSNDTVVVSGAAGAVGMMVGQIAKLKGNKVIGIAGGKDKCKYIVDELGFDAAIDYKNENVKQALQKQCPNGIDLYFDNVGGDILDDALSQLAMHARVVICGAISQYNSTTIKGPANYLSLLVNRATMKGFLVFDYSQKFPQAIKEMAAWIASGKIQSKEDIVVGIEKFPSTLLKLFSGENTGKLILEV